MLEGEPVTLECTSDTILGKDVGWVKVDGMLGRTLTRMSKEVIHNHGENGSVSYQWSFEATIDDEGQYYCFFDRFPNRETSNKTRVNVAGMVLHQSTMSASFCISMVIEKHY